MIYDTIWQTSVNVYMKTECLHLYYWLVCFTASVTITSLTVGSGGRSCRIVPQSIIKAWLRVIRWCRRGWRRDEVRQRYPLGERVQAHGVEVACGKCLGIVGIRVEALRQLVQCTIKGGFEHAGCTHAWWQAQRIYDLLRAGVWGQLAPVTAGQNKWLYREHLQPHGV